MWAEVSFILSQFTRFTNRWTDGRTDNWLMTMPRQAAYLQHGKNTVVVSQRYIHSVVPRGMTKTINK